MKIYSRLPEIVDKVLSVSIIPGNSIMEHKTRKVNVRKIWVETYETLGSISKTARCCATPKSTSIIEV